MQTFLQTLGFIAQLAVAGFVMWGGWRCFRAGLTKADGFERAASLVLLALLCTTMAALG